jgi:uncharacterized protein YecE (DUF72 family)
MDNMHKALEDFRFRGLHPSLFFGTASDRYSGWLGQIYSQDRYEGRLLSRAKSLDGKTYNETILPVDSVQEYFDHFPLLEIDFTFYRPLLDNNGKPTRNHHVLAAYQQHLKPDDKIIVKVPQDVFARNIKRRGSFESNPSYLDPDYFAERFYEPVNLILGANLAGFIFEQEYQRKDPGYEAEHLAADLRAFFEALPQDDRYHVEIRTDRLLKEPVLDVLENSGVGLVLSHWTWLPPLRDQHRRIAGRRMSGDQCIRLVTPRGKNYALSYDAAFPFSGLVAGMMSPDMVEDTVEIVRGEVKAGRRIYLIVNNRSGGNAPQIARLIAERVADSLPEPSAASE